MLTSNLHFLTDLSIWVRLATAIVCGLAIGYERQIHHKASGLRTMTLICLGSTLYVLVGEMMAAHGSENIDPTRIAAQIVTGIGFLGAGVIIHEGLTIHGLTTAATIWTAAAIGALIGAGYPLVGLVITGLIVVVLLIVSVIERRFLSQ